MLIDLKNDIELTEMDLTFTDHCLQKISQQSVSLKLLKSIQDSSLIVSCLSKLLNCFVPSDPYVLKTRKEFETKILSLLMPMPMTQAIFLHGGPKLN